MLQKIALRSQKRDNTVTFEIPFVASAQKCHIVSIATETEGNEPMQTYDKQSHLIYLAAKEVAERAHEVFVLKCASVDSGYAERELAKEYRELRSKLFERGMI